MVELPKVDVAVQSFRKPESMIYSLFSLHRHSADRVDRVFINDDGSGEEVVRHYRDPRLQERLAPWRISVRVNTRPTGYARQIHTARSPASLRDRPWHRIRLRQIGDRLKRLLGVLYGPEEDVRYQWAVNATDKQHLFVMHDDIRFNGDVIGLYLQTVGAGGTMAIVGDLGQCWACGFGHVCSPARIMEGERPYPAWPLTPLKGRPFPWTYGRSCRINEWCCLLHVGIARELSARGIYFGNYQDRGDVGAYWFATVVRDGHGFSDPLTGGNRGQFYDHGWQGHSGHAVWTEAVPYRADEVRHLLEAEYGYRLDPPKAGR